MSQIGQLGINPADAMIGILQPILYELGVLFAQRKISTVEEHRFSAFVENILSLFEVELKSVETSQANRVLLACADGNYHTIGIRMLALLLQKENIQSRCVLPGLPAKDLVELCKEIKPNVLGISLYTRSQLAYVKRVVRLFGSDRPKLIAVGGYFIKESPIALNTSIYFARSRCIDDIIERIKVVA